MDGIDFDWDKEGSWLRIEANIRAAFAERAAVEKNFRADLVDEMVRRMRIAFDAVFDADSFRYQSPEDFRVRGSAVFERAIAEIGRRESRIMELEHEAERLRKRLGE